MSVLFIPPCNPLLYSKTGGYRGIHNFLIFAKKNERVPTINVLSKNKIKIKFFSDEIFNCLRLKKVHRRVIVMQF